MLLRLSPLDDDAEAPEVPEYVRVRVRLRVRLRRTCGNFYTAGLWLGLGLGLALALR